MNENTVTVDTDEAVTTFDEFNDDAFLERDDLNEAVLDGIYNMELEQGPLHEAIQYALDTAIDAVLDWLRSTGHEAKAEILEDTYRP